MSSCSHKTNMITVQTLQTILFLLLVNDIKCQCHICGEVGNSGLKYPLGYIKSERATCVGIAMKVYQQSLSDAACTKKERKFESCCNGTELDVTPVVKKTPNRPIYYEGPFPICELCAGGTYPTDASHVIHLLYLGASTCKEYYTAGKRGKIPTHLCDPLRFFAREPCGCRVTVTRSSAHRRRSKPVEDEIVLIGLLILLLLILVCAKCSN